MTMPTTPLAVLRALDLSDAPLPADARAAFIAAEACVGIDWPRDLGRLATPEIIALYRGVLAGVQRLEAAITPYKHGWYTMDVQRPGDPDSRSQHTWRRSNFLDATERLLTLAADAAAPRTAGRRTFVSASSPHLPSRED